MIPPKAKLSPSEIAMIELMKLDDGYADYREDVDLSVPFEVREHYNAAPEKFLPRLVAERAKLYCRKKMQIPVDEVQAKWMHWVVVLAVFTFGSFLFFSIVTALGVPAMFFSGENREASVLAVSVLIGVMTLPCLIPAFSLLSLIFQRLTGRPQAAIADVILWIIRTCRDAWASLRGRALPSQQKTPNRFASMFRRNSYFASASTVFLSNLYFVLMGIAIWGVLWLFLFSRNVNYVHESSLSTAEERASFIESAAMPVTWVTGTLAPNEQAMQWAGGTFSFDEDKFYDLRDGESQPWSETEIATHKNRTIAGFRRDWSRFLLSSVWTWVFLPRVVIAIGSLACMAWFRRDFLPKHTDPDNRRIVEHVRKRRSIVEEVVVEQVSDDEGPVDASSSGKESDSVKQSSPFDHDPQTHLKTGKPASLPSVKTDVTSHPASESIGSTNQQPPATPVARSGDSTSTPKPVDNYSKRDNENIKPAQVSPVNNDVAPPQLAETPITIEEQTPFTPGAQPGDSTPTPQPVAIDPKLDPGKPKPAQIPPVKNDVAPPQLAASTAAKQQSLTAAVPRIPDSVPSRTTAIVGLGLSGDSTESTARLASFGKSVRDLGNLNGAKPQLRFRSDWKSTDYEMTDLVVLASLTSVPSVSQGDFLADVSQTASERASGDDGANGVQVILTDGKATREKGDNDPDFFETRVSQWMGRVIEAGVARENVREFDVSNDAGAKSAWETLSAGTESESGNSIQVAGKVSSATKIIRDQFAATLSGMTEDVGVDWSEQSIAISNKLSPLYAKERKLLTRFLDFKTCSDSVIASIKSAELPSGVMPEDLKTISKAMGLLKTVSPKWMAAGAFGGVGLGAIAGVAAVATGGATLVPVALSILPYSVLGGAVAGQLAKTFGFSKASAEENDTDFVPMSGSLPHEAIHCLQASILQVIVLELQGNPETVITHHLREQTERLDDHHPRCMQDIETMLDEFRQGMSEMRAAN